jgi:DMATS type aromatic prenyltransferase
MIDGPASGLSSAREYGLQQLVRLCDAIRLPESDKTNAVALFGLLSETWDQRPRRSGPEWRSDITGDHSPYEFSLAFDGEHCELRFLMEVQTHPMAMGSAWRAALEACERLSREFDVPLDRLQKIQDLFEPKSPDLRFGLWHAVCLRPSEPPDIKVYLNPNAQGPEVAAARVEQALVRLGFSNTWDFLANQVLKPRDRLAYFSLDLSRNTSARVKIYIVHPGLTAAETEPLMATDPAYTSGQARMFCQDVLGGEGPFRGRPVGTCFAFTEDRNEGPYTTTLHLPLTGYVENDMQSARALLQVLEPSQRSTLSAALAAITARPLDAGAGLIQWVSMRWSKGQSRMTAYLCPEAYRAFAPCPQPD